VRIHVVFGRKKYHDVTGLKEKRSYRNNIVGIYTIMERGRRMEVIICGGITKTPKEWK